MNMTTSERSLRSSPIHFMVGILFFIFSTLSPAAFAVDRCGGQISVGNPLPCCAGGNCTWWSWKKANEAGWLSIPTRHAKYWDDDAQGHPAYIVSSAPTVGSIGVKNEQPYNCGAPECAGVGTDRKNGCCDTGHVAWITGVTSTSTNTTQMSCGANGVQSVTRVGYFDKYVSKVDLNGQPASTCNDGNVIGSSTDGNGNTLHLLSSARCKTKWARITPKSSGSSVIVAVQRGSSSGLKKTASGYGTKTTTMVETGSILACATGKAGASSLPQVCK